jgi:dihydrodipicolinate synthase/N-acetylneuraminate lyase
MKRYRHGIMGTVCVPWNEDFSFAGELFRWQVRHLVHNGIRDLYVFGTAGEGYAVTEMQFDQITRMFLEETAQPGVQSLIGIISLSLPTIIERIERARAMGARRFQISLPGWGALNDAELDTFFRETCGRFPECEFMHYNLDRTRRLLTGADYARLAERHPNFVATKNGSRDASFVTELLKGAPHLRHFLTEIGFGYGGLVDECGLLISSSSVQPALAARYVQAAVERDALTLGAMQGELRNLVTDLHALVSGSAHMDGAYDKMFCKVHDRRFPLRLLPPYTGVTEEVFERFVDLLRTKYPRWLPAGSG